MPLSPGQQLGSFEIVSSIGAGGMGEVYRAHDTRLGRDVALKILPPEVTNEPGRLERFDREARAIAALNHPHIVTIYSTEHVDDVRFLTMELVDGCTLSDLVLPAGMAIPRFLEIAIPLADALAAAHQKQITHRDLKPGNVMVSSEGRVKVLDFGLARVGGANAGEQTLIATQAPITHQGTIVGTMPYMSPEQVEGRHLDARSDLFSLGVIFYELLNGGRPFQGSSSPALMSAILRDTPSSLREKRPDVPEAIDRLISRLLEKRPEDRVQTARDVYNELRHVQRTSDARSSSVLRTAAPSAAQNLWIAVLPFTTRGTNADAEAMAAGLTDDITTSLAKFSGLSVVAAQSTRAFKDSPLDVRQIAERIGARYMASGSVRQSGSAFRVSAQLIDAQSGAQLWSETYDRRLENSDLFTIQDDLTDRIVATLADESGVLARSMAHSIGQTSIDDPNEQQLIVQMWGFQHDPTPPRHEELRASIERQVELHPNGAEAWASLANLCVVEHALLFNPRPDPLGRALRAARRAVEIDRGCQKGWLWLGITHFHLHDRRGLEEAFERASAINPRNANAMGWMGNILAHAGDYDRGSVLSERAMQINPGHPGWLHFVVFTRQFAHGAFEEALQAARRVNIPNFFWMHFAIAAACGQLGLAEEGKAAYDAMVRIAPALGNAADLREFVSRWYWSEEMIESLINGVQRSFNGRSAGVLPSSDGRRTYVEPSVEPSVERPSNDRGKPPSSTSGSARGKALSIAVLPLVARSPDEESKALAEGLADDIAAGLSRFGHLRVRSRSASPADARYSLEGYVRKAGPSIRIGVTVVDTEAGANLWAEQYDRNSTTGAFVLQDDIASRVVATVGDQTGVLVRAMAASIAETPIEQLSVAELVVRYHLYAESFQPAEHARLRDAFQQQLEREPRNAEGWACLAMLCEHEHGFGFNTLPDALAREHRCAERAIELDPRSQQAWIAMASVHGFARDREALKAAVERAVSINPLNADMVALGGLFLSMAGEHVRASELVREAVSRKPQHAGWYHFPLFNGFFARGDYEAALRENKAMNMPKMPMTHLSAAAVSGQLSRAPEARAALAGLRAINPALTTVEAARALWATWIWDDAWIDALVDGFKKAKALEERSDLRADDRSIAVLPFVDLSEKKDQDWFCDGIAEEIMNALSGLPGLRVAPRTSAFSFRGRADDLEAIGERLNVNTVLEGSVRRAGDRVRITTRLSDAQLGRQLWSERFDRELKDIFDVQDEIARAIADRLRVTIAGAGVRLVQKATTNIAAYELMLKGRVFLNRRGPAIANAIPCFEQAIALDPNLADAHAGLGDSYRLLGIYGLMPTHQASELARTSLERALAIDPDQVEALATLANIMHAFEWNYAEARALSDRTLQRDPSHVRALAESAVTLSTSMAEHPSEGLRQLILDRIARARALDPLSAWAMAVEAMILSMLGRDQDAVDAAARAVATDPNNFTAHWSRVLTFAKQNRAAEAEEAAKPGLAMSSRHPILLTDLATLHARGGDMAGAESIYQELTERSTTSFISPCACAIAAAAAGRMTDARLLLAQAIADRDAFISFHKFAAFRPLWDDPECAAMIHRSPLMRNAPS